MKFIFSKNIQYEMLMAPTTIVLWRSTFITFFCYISFALWFFMFTHLKKYMCKMCYLPESTEARPVCISMSVAFDFYLLLQALSFQIFPYKFHSFIIFCILIWNNCYWNRCFRLIKLCILSLPIHRFVCVRSISNSVDRDFYLCSTTNPFFSTSFLFCVFFFVFNFLCHRRRNFPTTFSTDPILLVHASNLQHPELE